jgi:phosphoglycerol transferase MdoB-like AlkP superfamily enzyme
MPLFNRIPCPAIIRTAGNFYGGSFIMIEPEGLLELSSTAHDKRRRSGWNRFITQWQKDFKLWLFFITFFLLFRCAFIFLFRHQINASSNYRDVVAALFNGLRYDSVFTTYLLVIPLVFSIISGFANTSHLANKVRKIIGTVGVVLSTVACVTTFSYYREFGNQFDHFIFGLIYDDLGATVTTIWKEYHVIPNAIGMAVIVFAALKIMRRLIRNPFLAPQSLNRLTPTLVRKTVVGILLAAVFVLGIRGSLGRRPVELKDAGITNDEFLNKSVLNPFMALHYAVERHLELSNAQGIDAYLPDEDVRYAAQTYYSTKEAYDDLDRYMLRYAKGANQNAPRHIFLIVGEGLSAWPLMKKYEVLGLAEGVKHLAQNGLSVEKFVPASGSTRASLAAIVTGLPAAEVQTIFQKTARTAYPTSIAKIFRQLGYRTRFFYGGFLSWVRVGEFCRSQGFDEIYGGGHIGSWISSNEWGADDEHLFEFVLTSVDDDLPSFNMILTTTNHPPFDIDVRARGFDLREIPAELKGAFLADIDFIALGHYWYADQSIANFALRVEKKLDLPLVAITGDHAWRKVNEIIKRPDLYENTAVPLVFYGRDVLDGISLPPEVTGSHIDINTTLIELAAPQGFQYHALGKNLFDPNQNPLGVGLNAIIGPNFIVDMEGSRKVYPLPDRELPRDRPDLEQMIRSYNDLHGIAWWRIMRGSKL